MNAKATQLPPKELAALFAELADELLRRRIEQEFGRGTADGGNASTRPVSAALVVTRRTSWGPVRTTGVGEFDAGSDATPWPSTVVDAHFRSIHIRPDPEGRRWLTRCFAAGVFPRPPHPPHRPGDRAEHGSLVPVRCRRATGDIGHDP